ncbi:1-deoxy-D-xylulose-5-phosphate synthase (plasmid) [Streptomyces sp. BI20]|uniref:1-deoxy-D-xylulose-5-phosphate synthase n=1 Tax=Streptomyces sp. BI20 TaxID=3403460 RepID=UPI003C77D318
MLTPDPPGVDVDAPRTTPGGTTPAPARTARAEAIATTATDPARLRALPADQLPDLAARLRHALIEKVSATGGHLGASLGAVELTIALHRVFSSPRDVILFDTGHQSYAHKMLTGRAAGFDGLRTAGGLSGYPSRAESVHDWVENSHASTAPGYADGLAKAFALTGTATGTGRVGIDRRVVAVIGDGALTGGVALEALNNLGDSGRQVIVVLNDNGRSYDPTVGGIAAHLALLREDGRRTDPPRRRPPGPAGPREAARGNLFESLGFTYLGPVDGHDTLAVEKALRTAVAIAGPVVVHAVTVKGKGYPPAEADEDDRMHACGVIDPLTGRPLKPAGRTWTDVCGEELAAIADSRPDVVAITAAMRLPVGLGPFSRRHPDRVFDVGIAEQQAVTSAAGLAMGGLRPVVCLYATFLNRAADQVLMDVALHRLPVTFVLDRAGITGPDGPSHHGTWDLALLSRVPGMRLAAPRDPARLREALREAVAHTDGPTAVRYPKAGAGPDVLAVRRIPGGPDLLAEPEEGRSEVLLVTVGPLAGIGVEAARLLGREGVRVTVVDPRWVAPVDERLRDLALAHRLVVTVEDGIRTGGIGTLLAQTCADAGHPGRVLNLGLPPEFLPHASRDELLTAHGLTAEALADTIRTRHHQSGSAPTCEHRTESGPATRRKTGSRGGVVPNQRPARNEAVGSSGTERIGADCSATPTARRSGS